METNFILNEKIKEIRDLGHTNNIIEIINKMNPLIKKYVKKLFFMDKDDATQELVLSIIEAIYSLKNYDNEAMCLSYIQKSVINKYNSLCKKNILLTKNITYLDNISETFETPNCLNDTILYIDVLNVFNKLSDNQKEIFKYLVFYNLPDSDIAVKLNMSRQYINRIKKKIYNDYLIEYGGDI